MKEVVKLKEIKKMIEEKSDEQKELDGNCMEVFDDIEDLQINLGNLVLKAVQNQYNSEKVKRILNEEPTEQFYNKDFEKYDVSIKEVE